MATESQYQQELTSQWIDQLLVNYSKTSVSLQLIILDICSWMMMGCMLVWGRYQ